MEQFAEPVERFFSIRAFGFEDHFTATIEIRAEHVQNAARGESLAVLANAYHGAEFLRGSHKLGGGPRVKPVLVEDCHFPLQHHVQNWRSSGCRNPFAEHSMLDVRLRMVSDTNRFWRHTMKKPVLFAALLIIAGSAIAEDFVAPRQSRKRIPPSDESVQSNPVQGAIPQAVRTGRPLNLINPFAPKSYGTGVAFVSHLQADPFVQPGVQARRAVAFKLFAFEF